MLDQRNPMQRRGCVPSVASLAPQLARLPITSKGTVQIPEMLRSPSLSGFCRGQQKMAAQRFGSGGRLCGGCSAALKLAHRVQSRGFRYIDARALVHWVGQPAHQRDSVQGVISTSGVDLRSRQAKRIINVVGKEVPQSSVKLNRSSQIMRELAISAFDREPLLAGKIRR